MNSLSQSFGHSKPFASSHQIVMNWEGGNRPVQNLNTQLQNKGIGESSSHEIVMNWEGDTLSTPKQPKRQSDDIQETSSHEIVMNWEDGTHHFPSPVGASFLHPDESKPFERDKIKSYLKWGSLLVLTALGGSIVFLGGDAFLRSPSMTDDIFLTDSKSTIQHKPGKSSGLSGWLKGFQLQPEDIFPEEIPVKNGKGRWLLGGFGSFSALGLGLLRLIQPEFFAQDFKDYRKHSIKVPHYRNIRRPKGSNLKRPEPITNLLRGRPKGKITIAPEETDSFRDLPRGWKAEDHWDREPVTNESTIIKDTEGYRGEGMKTDAECKGDKEKAQAQRKEKLKLLRQMRLDGVSEF
jgi:hypothetical protein